MQKLIIEPEAKKLCLNVFSKNLHTQQSDFESCMMDFGFIKIRPSTFVFDYLDLSLFNQIFHFHHGTPTHVHLFHVRNVVLKEGKDVKITATCKTIFEIRSLWDNCFDFWLFALVLLGSTGQVFAS